MSPPLQDGAWIPSEAELGKLEMMAQLNHPEKDMWVLLGVPAALYREAKRSDERIQQALDKGEALFNEKLLKAVQKLGFEMENATAVIFMLKARLSWRDSDPASLNLNAFNLSTMPSMDEAMQIVKSSAERKCINPVVVDKEP